MVGFLLNKVKFESELKDMVFRSGIKGMVDINESSAIGYKRHV
jgi:hypothetical protein